MTTPTHNPDSDAASAVARALARRQASNGDTGAMSQSGIARAFRQWLPEYCQALPGLTRAFAVIGGPDGKGIRQVAGWPDDLPCPAQTLELAAVALYGQTSVTKVRSANGWVDRIVLPITHKTRVLGGLLCEAENLSSEQRATLLEKVSNGVVTTAQPPAATPASPPNHQLETVIDLLAVCLDASHAQAARMAFVTEAATRIGCDRVSYGRIVRGQTQLLAMSNSARIERRSNLVRALEAAMDEAVEQGVTISYPGEATDIADRAHARLSRQLDGAHLLSIPIAHEAQLVGALVLERHGPTPFDPRAVALCESLGSVAGPILELRHRDEAPLPKKIGAWSAQAPAALLGPRHKGAKLLALIAVSAAAWFSLATGTYRITAPARIEGRVTRAIVAPMDGFIATSEARAGDELAVDSVLARLDDSELKLELSKWGSELAQLRKQYRNALAAHDRAETAIVHAQIARAIAQVELLESQLARTTLRAPIAGIVVAGDLTQLLGSPVERGEVLFEIAPLDDYRVVLEVDERDLVALIDGQNGKLALEGLPGQRLPVTIDNITPVATARDGRNFFRVEARLSADVQALRPGMAGVAKIDAGERKLAWIYSHRLIDWLRLRLWRWRP